MLRDAIKSGSEVGLQAKAAVESGALVSDDIMVNIILARLKEPDCVSRGWLLDGFPRTSAQAQALINNGVKCDVFLQLDVSDELLLERVLGRRTDPETGKIYHMKYSPPENDEIAARLVQRADDTEEKFKTRIENYHTNLGPVLANFPDTLYSLKVTSADHTPSAIYEDIKKEIKKRVTRPVSKPTQPSSSSGAKGVSARGPPKIIISGAPGI